MAGQPHGAGVLGYADCDAAAAFCELLWQALNWRTQCCAVAFSLNAVWLRCIQHVFWGRRLHPLCIFWVRKSIGLELAPLGILQESQTLKVGTGARWGVKYVCDRGETRPTGTRTHMADLDPPTCRCHPRRYD